MLKRLCLIILIILSLTGLLLTPAYAEERYGFLLKWGGVGTESGKFRLPWDISIDSNNNIYVLDYGNNRIQKFTNTGMFIMEWGKVGSNNGEFYEPLGITTDSEGNVYVADRSNNRIQKFTSTGKFIMKFGGEGTPTGRFKSPGDVAIDSKNNVYVVDYGNNRIQSFTEKGEFITQWGSYGTNAGQFNEPISIAIDSKDNIYIVDSGNDRIQKFTSNGNFITMWGSRGIKNGQFQFQYLCGMGGIGVDLNDNIYVADAWNSRIQKFTKEGIFITKWGSVGTENGQFALPVGIELDQYSNVYVVDFASYIQKFIPLSSVVETYYSIPVYPNPYKVDTGHKYIEFGKSDEPLKRLPEYGTIKIYTITGELVKTLNITPADGGTKKWYVDNETGRKVASGIYIYCISDSEGGRKYKGKIGIIK